MRFVRACSAEDEREYRRFGQVLRLRLLYGLAGAPLVAAGTRDVNGTNELLMRNQFRAWVKFMTEAFSTL